MTPWLAHFGEVITVLDSFGTDSGKGSAVGDFESVGSTNLTEIGVLAFSNAAQTCDTGSEAVCLPRMDLSISIRSLFACRAPSRQDWTFPCG